MEAVIDAVRSGDYARAHDALQQAAGIDATVRTALGAFLLALAERFDDALQLLEATDLPAIRVIVDGERQRLTRWRSPDAHGSLDASARAAHVPLRVAIGCAFVHNDLALAERAAAQLAEQHRPAAGKLTLVGGEVRPFRDLCDADDAIGQMLETYCGEGLLYFPFASLRRVEIHPRTNFMDHLMPKVTITDDAGTSSAYVPLLYANSTTASAPQLRTGATTMFDYLGPARRGVGQRDFVADGNTLIALQHIVAIEFD